MIYPYKTGIIFTLPAILFDKAYGYGLPPSLSRLAFRKGAKPILKKLDAEGYLTFMICNLPEVAKNKISIEVAHTLLECIQIYHLGDYPFHQIQYAYEPHMPRYLPGTDMIQEIVIDFKQKKERLLIVGATSICRKTAKACQIDYCSYEVFFSILVPKRYDKSVTKAKYSLNST